MAESQQRARLIREMSRDLNRTRPTKSSRSSDEDVESTASGFDPENEALMSTRQGDNFSQPLPELHASAEKYSRFARPEADYAINTSAIGRAFPDFSQDGTSLDEDDSMSIEIGRGVKTGTNGSRGDLRDYSSSIRMDSMDFSPVVVGQHQYKPTPPKQSLPQSKKPTGNPQGSIRRDAQIRRASAAQKQAEQNTPIVAKATDYGSSGSRQSSGENHQSLAALHARISEEYDGSHISDERPATLNLTSRSTRFGNGQAAKGGSVALPPKFTSTKDFVTALSKKAAPKHSNVRLSTNNATVASTTQGIENSFMLPDLPNLSELVSGVFQDGTPVFSRYGKPRSSRFASGAYQGDGRSKSAHAAIASIPIPDDEQAIFMSLRLLQDKVANLENIRAESEVMIRDLQERNQTLEQEKSERRRVRRSDSALGTTDGSDDAGEPGLVGGVAQGSRKHSIEKSRLESTVRALQEQLNATSKKASVSEITIRNLTQERDAAVSQLGVAYFTIEQLKSENQGLSDENEELKAQNAQLRGNRGDRSQKFAAGQRALQGRTGTSKSHQKVTEESEHRNNTRIDQESRPAEQHKAMGQRGIGDKNDVNPSYISSTKDFEPRSELHNIQRRKKTRMVMEEYSESEASDDAVDASKIEENHKKSQALNEGNNADGTTGDVTYLSFLDSGEIAKLRKTLEEERMARKQRGSMSKAQGLKENVTQTGQSRNSLPALPRKSSMKDLTGRASIRADSTVFQDMDKTNQSKVSRTSTQHHNRHAEESLLEHDNRRDGIGMDDLTSAFIIPDITMHARGTVQEPTLKLSAAAKQVFDGLAKHDGQNCTVCKRVMANGLSHKHDDSARETIKIPKPVPVSERMPEANLYEEEPTMRPSQQPAIALATVLKGLEDELAHLKIQLSQHQAMYNQQDPSLSKRKRKSVLVKIETLLQTVDVKADQIYALYDVVEGQKADGHEIGEQEIEVTLQSIGIDLATLGLRGGEVAAEEAKVQSRRKSFEWDAVSNSSDEDLPWEGIESTVDTTGKSFGAGRRSSWGL